MPKYPQTDSRFFTDYSTNCAINRKIQSSNGIQEGHKYREFLQKNGIAFIKSSWMNPNDSIKTTSPFAYASKQ